MSALLAGVAGLVCGVLSGLGIGGGTLLMVWMTAVMDMEQRMAQGINLLYFLPTAACALIFHIKNRLIRWRVVLPAAITGCLSAAGAALLATSVDASLLRKLFGRHLRVGGSGRMYDKALYVGHIGQQREYLQRVNKLPCCGFASLYLKGKDAAATVRIIFLIQFMIRMLL